MLFAIVRALQLDEAETAHLFDLARAASSGPPRAMRRRPESRVSTHLVRLIDAMHDVPAIALTRLGDPVASNPLARALFPHPFPTARLPSITRATCFSTSVRSASIPTGRPAPESRCPRCGCSPVTIPPTVP